MPPVDWLAPFKWILGLVIGKRGAAAAAKLIVDVDVKALTICKPVVMREGRAFIFSRRTVVHARKVGHRIRIDFTPVP